MIKQEEIEKLILDHLTAEKVKRYDSFDMAVEHFHQEYEIYYLSHGERYYFIENQTYHIPKGSLVVIDQQQIHKTTTSNLPEHERYLLLLEDDYLSATLSLFLKQDLKDFMHLYQGIYVLDSEDQTLVEKCFDSLFNIDKSSLYFDSLVHSKIIELLLMLPLFESKYSHLRRPISTLNTHQVIHEVSLYISNHFKENPSLDTLSKHFYINKSYLSRIFKQLTGFTVHEYINIHKIKLAQKLLKETTLSIATIAQEVGYESSNYFIRVFKHYNLMSPLQYRKNQL